MDLKQLLDIVNTVGLVGVLVMILWGGAKRLWVYGWYYREQQQYQIRLVRERNEWRDIALRGTVLAEKAVSVLKEDVQVP